MSIGAVILAAGGSRRLGQPKQLLPCGGEPLVRAIARRALAVCDSVCVVLGAAAIQILPAVASLPVDVIECRGWREGMAASLRTGITWAEEAGHDAALVCACDQPRLDIQHLANLLARHRDGARIVASRYDGVVGIPAILSRDRFADVLELQGDHGARALLRAAPELDAIDWPDGALDIDTPAALEAWLGG